jgi:hypothetical protein
MTSITSQLLEMRSAKDSSVWLFCSQYGKDWNCWFEIDTKALKLKVERSGDTPEAAVAACYEAWRALQTGVPDIRPTLLVAPNFDSGTATSDEDTEIF